MVVIFNSFFKRLTFIIEIFKTFAIKIFKIVSKLKLGDSRNYMPPILVLSSAKRMATQILVIAKLNERKDFILRAFVCDIIRPSKELSVQCY